MGERLMEIIMSTEVTPRNPEADVPLPHFTGAPGTKRTLEETEEKEIKKKEKKPFLIGVAGGTASGKTSVCRKIIEKLGQTNVEAKSRRVTTVALDDFYRPLEPDTQKQADRGHYNFDHPNAIDQDMIKNTLLSLMAGQKVEIQRYDFRFNSHSEDTKMIFPADVILVEGILIFYFQELRELFDMKIFVDMDADYRLARRAKRDVDERGRTIDYVLHQYTSFVKPAFEDFCLPTKKYADIIIPRGAQNDVAVHLICQHIESQLTKKAQLVNEPQSKTQSGQEPSPNTRGVQPSDTEAGQSPRRMKIAAVRQGNSTKTTPTKN